MEAPLILISFFICTAALVFGIRYMSNKEKMAMIERGIDPGIRKVLPSAPKPFLSLKFGLLLVGIGLGLIIALFTDMIVENSLDLSNRHHSFRHGESTAIYFGFIGIFGGIGLILSYVIERKWLENQK
ncbi:DUF6249 domain-containing protein [Pedobacter metabolipauper]|uniref:DUF6249 domain-containing protein n=1 Tax=Pedobacter metabolipauper TaxID=425513 RepID=A0A4R6SY33_9SPHI|nr:DUF6249 domain-containing protein [Pedobacter metabolipauper]TDQ09612.1 hypothetical protein ATK78_1768 [Pedobacter metabolipauper]